MLRIWGHYGFFWIFPATLFLFFIVMMIVRVVMFRRYGRMGGCGRCGGYGYGDGRFEAEALLRRRLVNGEINEEEYNRLKEILSK